MTLPNFKNLNYQNKIYIITFLVLIVSALISYFIIFSQIKNLKFIRVKIMTEKVEFEKKLLKEKNMVNLNEKIKKITPQLNTLDSIFINQNRELEFITTFENIATRNSIDQDLSISFEQANLAQRFKKIPISINASGYLNNLINYLVDLETLGYYININSLQLSSSRSAQPVRTVEGEIVATQQLYNINFKANTYWK